VLQKQIAEAEISSHRADPKKDVAEVNGEKDSTVTNETTAVESPLPFEIRIAVLGQRGSGKTTLIHALLENELPPQDRNTQSTNDEKVASQNSSNDQSNLSFPIFKPTKKFQTHPWDANPCGAHFVLLDTPGYEPKSTGRKLNKIIQFTVDNAHAILLTLDSRSESWEADKELLDRIQSSFHTKANLKPARTIGAIVYRKPEIPTAASIDPENASSNDQQASVGDHLETSEHPQAVMDQARTCFEGLVDEFVMLPEHALKEPNSIFKDRLVSALIRHRDAARSNAVLTAYEDSLNRDKYRILYRQTKSSVKNLLSNWLRRDH
jgi:signal recognition particle receptor subunit beta